MTDVKFFVRHRTDLSFTNGEGGTTLIEGGYVFLPEGLAKNLEDLGAGHIVREPATDVPKFTSAADLYRLKQDEALIEAFKRREQGKKEYFPLTDHMEIETEAINKLDRGDDDAN